MSVAGVGVRSAGATSGRRLWRDRLLVTSAVLAAIFAHLDALRAMVDSWNSNPMYSYGYIVPVISGYLLWTQRERLSAIPKAPCWRLGIPLVLLGAGVAFAGRLGGVQVLDQLAFLVTLVAGVVLVLGRRVAGAARAALAYLLLMIPMWDGLTEHLHEPFQYGSAAIGVSLLQSIGIPAHRESTLITLPGITLEVARACSGVNYLIAVLALGLPLAYVCLPGVWRRAMLLVAAVGVAAVSNGLRVALIGFLAHFDIGSPLHGPFHVLHGLFVAGIGYVVLFLGLRILTPRQGTAQFPHRNTTPQPGETGYRTERVSLQACAVFVTACVVAGSNLLVRADVPAQGTPVSLEGFARVLGPWEFVECAEATEASLFWPGADAELRRRYRRRDGVMADLFIGYFADPRQGREIVSYRATEVHNRATRVQLGSLPGPFAANRASAGRDKVIVFWYELSRGPEVNRFAVKVKTLWDAVVRRHSAGAVVALSSVGKNLSNGRELEELAPLVRSEIAARMSRP